MALAAILLRTAHSLFAAAGPARFAVETILFLAAFALAGGLATLTWRIFKGLPAFYVWVLACTVTAFILLALLALPVLFGLMAFVFGPIIAASLAGAGVAALARGGWQENTGIRRVIAVVGLAVGTTCLVLGGIWLLDDGSPAPSLRIPAPVAPLDMPDPSQPGSYRVLTLFYGSGQDRHRPEYGADVDLITAPVDGSALAGRWTDLRTAYWGFGPEALPLNGRVWRPDGRGPFPLVLIAHGNHEMEDFSDAGYAYLGELLASRGFIVASVDENFLNLSAFADALVFTPSKDENDLRGWLLLEHLRLWRDWNATPDNPFFGQVDLRNVALMGHSRGGEAIAVAAAFNRLPYYPDDATVRFDYGFDIRSLVAIAPVDGQYRPTGREIALENVNYLVLHGAHDMDVVSFAGARQYARVRFSDDKDWFKAALYIYGANHGQFNTLWGHKDLFEPLMRVYNLEQLLPAEQQEQIAKVTISAFLEATLRGESGYRPLFQDHHRGGEWLPDTRYISQYQDAATRLINDYEEDINLATTTLPGGVQTGENLAVWREQLVEAKWGDMGNHAVYLGWNAESAATTPRYAIRLPKHGLTLTRKSILVFALADANEDPTPERNDAGKRGPIDLTVEMVDGAGERARLPLSRFSLLQPQVEGRIGKAAFMSPLPLSEVVFQHFELPLADFVAANPALDPASLVQVRFVFDRTPAAVIALDDVGFRSSEE
ncbi:MAG TPA: MFS transporter [Anaerolineae bacterium]|nr:MFS transporter [Anaerolineae bacterium]